METPNFIKPKTKWQSFKEIAQGIIFLAFLYFVINAFIDACADRNKELVYSVCTYSIDHYSSDYNEEQINLYKEICRNMRDSYQFYSDYRSDLDSIEY